MTTLRTTVLAALALTSLAGADALAKKMKPPVFKVQLTKVVAAGCSTDGGSQPCPTGTRYLGEVLKRYLADHDEETTRDCAFGTKAGTFTVHLAFEYNDGTMGFIDEPKAQAKWPDCVKDFATHAGELWHGWYKILQPIDPTIDVRTTYKLTIAIKPV
jgi:hypothetical protein